MKGKWSMKRNTKDEMITEWLEDKVRAVSSLADYTAITNAEWLKREQARLTARGIETKIVKHPTRPGQSALKRVLTEGKRHG
jgi:hypothetical protein